jgi:hypothetical protein
MESIREYSIRPELEKAWKHRKLILGGALLMSLITLGISLLVPNEYRATVKFKPPNFTNLLGQNYLPMLYQGIGVGRSADVELMVERMGSYDAFFYLHHRLNLGEAFNVKRPPSFRSLHDSLQYVKRIWEAYEDHVEVKISKYGLVWVNVWHKDPVFAATMANLLLEFADSTVESIAKRRIGLQKVLEYIQKLESEQKAIFDTLAVLRKKFLLYPVNLLSDAVGRQIAEAMLKYPQFAESYAFMMAMEHRIEKNEQIINQLKSELEVRERILETYPTLLTEVEKAYPSTIYKRPYRSLLVFLSFLGGIFLFSLFAVLYENYRSWTFR